MSVHYIPMYGDGEERLILTESDKDLKVTVPLVVYIDGQRHIIGEATVHGETVSAVVGDDVSDEIMDQLHMRPDVAHFSIGFSEGPNPFRPTYVPDEVAHVPPLKIPKNLYPKTEFNKPYDGPLGYLEYPSEGKDL